MIKKETLVSNLIVGLLAAFGLFVWYSICSMAFEQPATAQINYNRSRPKCPGGVCPTPLTPLSVFEDPKEPSEIIVEQVPMQSQTVQRSTMGRDRCGLICRIRQNRQARVQTRRSRRGR